MNFQNYSLSQISAKRAKKVQNLKFYLSRIFLDRHAKIFYYIKNMLRQVSFLVAFYMPNNCGMVHKNDSIDAHQQTLLHLAVKHGHKNV